MIITARHSAKVVALLVVTSAVAISSFAATVYDNSKNYRGTYYSSTNEFGDQISLDTSAANKNQRLLTNFKFDYYLTTNANHNESLTFKLYANDGAGGSLGTELTAGQQISMALNTGYNTVSMDFSTSGPFAVSLPDSFTWTVVFSGVDPATEKAGLLIYDPPTVGTSYADLWEKTGATWSTKLIPGYAANFGAVVTAVPELSTWQYAMLGGLVWLSFAGYRRLAVKRA
jgi:hypothetical protein